MLTKPLIFILNVFILSILSLSSDLGMAECILVKIWHGGKVIQKPKVMYDGGQSTMFQLEVDKIFELADYVMECGSYPSKDFVMYYSPPGLKVLEGLVQLKDDHDVNDMILRFRFGRNFTQKLLMIIQPNPLT